ncbi:MAG: hypothetical protein K2P81_11805 [Bacteriovoracaceae bacterium]|nr:hypothetical protein [Bacteriovoracaceae bacterium]
MSQNPSIDELSEEDFLYGRKGPWPQPQPAHPLGEAPGVVHVPINEWADWWLHVGSRYLLTLSRVPWEYLKSFMEPGLESVSDVEFNNYLSRSMITKFITPDFDSKDIEIFKSFELKGKFLIDLEAIKCVHTFKGLYVSGTKVLLNPQSSHYIAEAIWVDETKSLIRPPDAGWELAKYFVLQGAAIASTLVVHPLIHFPLDSVNAVTKTALPKNHPLFKLFEPHLRFTLPLENAVLNFKSSLLQSKWWMPYAPYPGFANGLRDLLVEGFKGIKGNLSYPAYKFPLSPQKVYSSYGDFQDAYWPVFLNFATEMLKDVKRDDHLVKNWAQHLSHMLPGFPNAHEISQSNTLEQVAASYLWQVSVGHTVDHYDYGHMDVRKVPLRLRQAPPSKNDEVKNRKKLVTFWDTGKYRMAQILFFRNSTVTKLIDCQYRFEESSKRAAIQNFKEGLKRVDREVKAQNICFIPLEEIAASIQF